MSQNDPGGAEPPQDGPDRTFGQWLTEARAWCRLTPDELARRAHLPPKAVAGLEQGALPPSRRLVYHLARALTPPDVSRSTATELLSQGLVAAGLLSPDDLPAEPVLDKLRQGRFLAEIPPEIEREISALIAERAQRRRGG